METVAGAHEDHGLGEDGLAGFHFQAKTLADDGEDEGGFDAGELFADVIARADAEGNIDAGRERFAELRGPAIRVEAFRLGEMSAVTMEHVGRLHPLQPGEMRGDGAVGLKKRIPSMLSGLARISHHAGGE